MATVEAERPDLDDTTSEHASSTRMGSDKRPETVEGRIDTNELSPRDAAELHALPVRGAEAPRAVSTTSGTPHDPDPRRAARASAAKALVMVRRRTGKAIPADVLALAAEA